MRRWAVSFRSSRRQCSKKAYSTVEAGLAGAEAPASFQFLRQGYFCVDNKDSAPGHLVFNRSVSLKDSFKF